MRQRPFILLALAVSLVGSATSARAQAPSATPAAIPDKTQQPPANSPAQTPGPDTNQPQKPANPAVKPHHVITNDDLACKGDVFGNASADIDINNINDCDRNCFDRVRTGAPGLVDGAGQWKRDLLRGIDKGTADG